MKKYLGENTYISIGSKFVKIYTKYTFIGRISKYEKGKYLLEEFSEEQLCLAKKNKDGKEIIKILDL